MHNLWQQILGLCGVFVFFRIPLLSDLPEVTFTVYCHSHPRGEMETPTTKYSPENTVHSTEFPIQFRKQLQDVVLYCAKSRMYIKKRQCGPFFSHFKCRPLLPPLLLTPATLNAAHCCPSFRVQKRGRGEETRKATEALKDDESVRKRKQDGFLSWLSSRCSVQQTPAYVQTWKRRSRLFPSVVEQSKQKAYPQQHTAWVISNHYAHTHTQRRAAIIMWWLLELML